MDAAVATVGIKPLQQTLVVQGYALVGSCQADPYRCDGQWSEETADAFDAWVASRGLAPGPQVINEQGLVTSAQVASVVRQAVANLPSRVEPVSPQTFVPPFMKRGDGGLRWGMVVGLGIAVLLVVLGGAALRSSSK